MVDRKQKLHSVMFFGPQGSGKGTQKQLLKEKLEQETGKQVVELELGLFFRELVQEEGYTNSLVRKTLQAGKLQPDFLSSYGATKILVEEYSGEEHIIADGFPRKQLQAELFHEMVEFYGLHVVVMVLDLSQEESIQRLLLRGRDDDTEAGIKERLGWYIEEVQPLVEYFARYPKHYTVHTINGEQSIEAVHQDVIVALGL